MSRYSQEQLPTRFMFGALLGKGAGGGRKALHRTHHHREDLKAFVIDRGG